MSITPKTARTGKGLKTEEIIFGLDRHTDERSLALFLSRFIDPALLEILLPRLSDAEIEATVDFLSGLLKNHLTGKEYHRLFLSN